MMNKNELFNKKFTPSQLSLNARQCLSKINVHTFNDLIEKTKNELLEINNLTLKSFKEIEEKLQEYGLEFSPNPEINILERSIKTVGFSRRTINTLHWDSICTVGDLIKWESKELLKIPNLGTKALKGIKEFLSQHDLKLLNEVDSPCEPTLEKLVKAINDKGFNVTLSAK